MSFSSLGLSEPLLRAVADRKYAAPTPIQTSAIPAILRTMNEDEFEFVRSAATNALKAIDPQAIAKAGVK